ncbi:hypothetical protein G7067_04985 [Leucobacter insecticola]|uniref:Uncharacterized protein n=1 Tax=Leucobacter insecticola TaxID=2714934 RepID=A0A6G8FI08_9MICO|nr:hypothetical protein [Leucobacter insecticola]QIM15919.1 hypothetical protein G7067_04985 [Leucobacter insecticola]
MSDSDVANNSSAEEQLAWLESELTQAMQVVGQEEGWWKYKPENLWETNREAILANLRVQSCRPNQKGVQPGRYEIRLGNREVADWAEAAERLRTFWTDQGWTVSYIVPPGSTQTPMEYFRADREDGAYLAFNAGDNFVALDVHTACSTSNLYPQRPANPPNLKGTPEGETPPETEQ